MTDSTFRTVHPATQTMATKTSTTKTTKRKREDTMSDSNPSTSKRMRMDPDKQMRDTAERSNVSFSDLKAVQTSLAIVLMNKDKEHKAQLGVLEAKLAAAETKLNATERAHKNEVVALKVELEQRSIIQDGLKEQVDLLGKGKQIGLQTIAVQREQIQQLSVKEDLANDSINNARLKLAEMGNTVNQYKEQCANSEGLMKLQEEERKKDQNQYEHDMFCMRERAREQTQEMRVKEKDLNDEKRKRAEIEHVRCTLCLKRPVEAFMIKCQHIVSCWPCWQSTRSAVGAWTANCIKCRKPHLGRVGRIVYN